MSCRCVLLSEGSAFCSATSRLRSSARADRQAQLLDVERLRDVVVRAPLDRLHRAGDVAERGDQDDRRRRRLARERGQHVEAARAFHAHVGDDQVVAALLRALDRARAVVDRLDLVALAAQDLAQQIARDPIVLGDQHARRRRRRRVVTRASRRARPRLGDRGTLARQANEERRPLARLALDRDRPAQRRRQLPADGEAEAGALAAPLGRVERLEDAPQVVGRDAVAGVAHGDQDIVVRDRARLHIDAAVAIDGVERVRQQIDDDLAQQARIGDDLADARRHLPGDLTPASPARRPARSRPPPRAGAAARSAGARAPAAASNPGSRARSC